MLLNLESLIYGTLFYDQNLIFSRFQKRFRDFKLTTEKRCNRELFQFGLFNIVFGKYLVLKACGYRILSASN